jgi:O-glycosyl hydrolase
MSIFAVSIFSTGLAHSATVNVNFSTIYQEIDGFGGMNGNGWIDDLTTAQAQKAFGTGADQMGLSIMRIRIDPDSNQWYKQVSTAQYAASHRVKLLATPWTPPAYMKDNNSLINGGKLMAKYYWEYTDHLNNFVSYMQSNSAPLYALSLQNEPDWQASYESCEWGSSDFVNYLKSQGSHLDRSVKIVAPESLNFNHSLSDPMLKDASTVNDVDIIGGHLYDDTIAFDYPLAREKGKKLWMTEHFTNNDDGDLWPSALDVGTEIHQSMIANYSAYIWWYIRRSYGLLKENGEMSKRGYVMSQYARFVRPGFKRIDVTEKPITGVYVSAYKNNRGKLVIVAINTTSSHQQLDFTLKDGGHVDSVVKYSTSEQLNVGYGGTYSFSHSQTTVSVDPQSIATFVSQS